jgi:TonB family protein
LPTYPEEALKKGATGVIEVRVGFNEQGEVEKVKVPPDINPLFRKAVVVAAKRWKFHPSPTLAGTGVITTSRLTFRFFIQDGEGRVELFDPPWGSKGASRIRESYSSIREWEQWEDATDEDESLDGSPSPPA